MFDTKDNNEAPRFEPRFELILQVRDGNAQPTGKVKVLKTDFAAELERFYDQNCTWEWDQRNRRFKVRKSGKKRRARNKKGDNK